MNMTEAEQAEYRRIFRQNSGRDPPREGEGSFDGALAAAARIEEGDMEEARRLIVVGASWFGADELQREQFLHIVKKRVKGGAAIPLLRELWEEAAAMSRALNAPTPDELAWLEAEAKRTREQEKRLEAERLAPLAVGIAKDPKLIERMVRTVTAFGVVGEEGGILASCLTATSRLLRRRCLSLLRRGAPASGKNYVFEHALMLAPPESVVTINSASSMALIYHSVEDPDSLKHKIVYLPEAASTLAVKNGVETEFTAMLRQLISENRINRQVAIPQKQGPPKTMEVVKNGPIAVLVTSARNNVEGELLTRLLLADSDESPDQTANVVTSILDTAAGAPWAPPPSGAEIEEWRDFQRWLEAGGPYDVLIPFGRAIRAAFTLTSAPTPPAVRVRRDISGLVGAISASTILHKAQRQADAKGRLIATLDDYQHAFGAFAPGMAAHYRPQVSAGVIALVKAIETMIEAARARIEAEKAAILAKNPGADLSHMTFDETVRATHEQLKVALGIVSKDAIGTRIHDALTAGVIEITNPAAARSAGGCYRVKVGSAALKAAAGIPVFPTPAMVETMINDPAKLKAALEAIAAEQAANEDVEAEEPDDDADDDPV
jgi:hypothetical protein